MAPYRIARVFKDARLSSSLPLTLQSRLATSCSRATTASLMNYSFNCYAVRVLARPTQWRCNYLNHPCANQTHFSYGIVLTLTQSAKADPIRGWTETCLYMRPSVPVWTCLIRAPPYLHACISWVSRRHQSRLANEFHPHVSRPALLLPPTGSRPQLGQHSTGLELHRRGRYHAASRGLLQVVVGIGHAYHGFTRSPVVSVKLNLMQVLRRAARQRAARFHIDMYVLLASRLGPCRGVNGLATDQVDGAPKESTGWISPSGQDHSRSARASLRPPRADAARRDDATPASIRTTARK